jgi:DNA replication protein DnaC
MTPLDIPAQLADLGFRTKPDALAALLQHAHKQRLTPTQTVEHLIASETRARADVNLARRTAHARLGPFKSMVDFDWQHPTKIDRPLIKRLLALDFIKAGENVLIKGPSGLGKTMLAQNLGHAALAAGYSVRFATLAEALAGLLSQESIPAAERRLRFFAKPDLLILDELGYLPCDSRAADMLYNVVSRRHERRSIVITTNLPFKQWDQTFPGAACVVALVDRFAQHCHRVDITGPSYRDKHRVKE